MGSRKARTIEFVEQSESQGGGLQNRTRRPALSKVVGLHCDKGEGRAVGLYLQVRPSKRAEGGVVRSWLYRYASPLTGKPRDMGLGPADAFGLAKAREKARAARAQVY